MNLHLGDCLDVLRSLPEESVDALITDPPAGISFMGKAWDSDKGGRDHWIAWLSDVMRECLRVLKPGAHGLVWSLPRTSHWTAMALENAGFEVRDCVSHLFGSGFPKSHDVSKAIDRAYGAEREIIGYKKKQDIRGGALNAEKKVAETGYIQVPQTTPSTDAAKQWVGWGTALKPAVEMWWLIRKPISEKTVAANVIKWGCGGINVDTSRIVSNGDHRRPFQPTNNDRATLGKQSSFMPTNAEGRFPANLVLSHSEHCTDDQCDIECAIKMLDEQSGLLKSGCLNPSKSKKKNAVYGKYNQANINYFKPNQGGASRFFYCAKASKSDKGTNNTHPTVKSSKLMSYLIKLITPPNGLVLDPFMGSGSTGVAALKEGFKFIGIEKEQEYFQISQKRINTV